MKKFVFLLTVLALFIGSECVAEETMSRSETWAKSVNATSLDNFFKIDEHLYRSAQPDKDGMKQLEALGIPNILNLREYHSDDDEAKGTGLKLHRVAMSAGSLKDEDIIGALKIIKNAKDPVLVHCWHGSDRTGAIVAMYRIIFQNWSKKEAIEELKKGGYGYHSIYANIPKYIENVDVEFIRKSLNR